MVTDTNIKNKKKLIAFKKLYVISIIYNNIIYELCKKNQFLIFKVNMYNKEFIFTPLSIRQKVKNFQDIIKQCSQPF